MHDIEIVEEIVNIVSYLRCIFVNTALLILADETDGTCINRLPFTDNNNQNQP